VVDIERKETKEWGVAPKATLQAPTPNIRLLRVTETGLKGSWPCWGVEKSTYQREQGDAGLLSIIAGFLFWGARGLKGSAFGEILAKGYLAKNKGGKKMIGSLVVIKIVIAVGRQLYEKEGPGAIESALIPRYEVA